MPILTLIPTTNTTNNTKRGVPLRNRTKQEWPGNAVPGQFIGQIKDTEVEQARRDDT